jgi:hypothetical protein
MLFSRRVRYGLSNAVRAGQRRSRLRRRVAAIPPSPPINFSGEKLGNSIGNRRESRHRPAALQTVRGSW